MAKVLIAGCGYVGGALARQLAHQGHTVYGLRRNTGALPGGVRPLSIDLADEACPLLPGRFDAIFYMVGAADRSEAAYRAAYITWPLRLLEATAHRGLPGRVFFVSSTGVYQQNNGESISEESPAQPEKFSGRILLEGEDSMRNTGMPITVVRLSGIYGPGRERMIDNVRNGIARRIRGTESVLNHIHRDDAAGALAHLMHLHELAPLYLGTDCEPVNRNACLEWIARQLGVAPPDFAEHEVGASERGGHRYYRNALLLQTGYQFLYPSYREGYASLLS